MYDPDKMLTSFVPVGHFYLECIYFWNSFPTRLSPGSTRRPHLSPGHLPSPSSPPTSLPGSFLRAQAAFRTSFQTQCHYKIYSSISEVSAFSTLLGGTAFSSLWVVVVCCSVTHLCPTLCDPMDRSPPRSSVHGILQVRILE